MAIKYYLLDNPLTPDPRDCRAQVASIGTKTLDDVIARAAAKGTLVTKTDLKAVTDILFDVMTEMVAEGYSLVTPLCNVKPSIKGVFENNKASFNPTIHEVKPKITAGKLLKEAMAKAQVEKVEAGENKPLILEFLDETSGSADSEITPGGMGILTGSRLAFDKDDADQGLFFIDATGTETKVSRIGRKMPGEVIFTIPDTLTQGFYSFRLRTKIFSQEIREGAVTNLEVK